MSSYSALQDRLAQQDAVTAQLCRELKSLCDNSQSLRNPEIFTKIDQLRDKLVVSLLANEQLIIRSPCLQNPSTNPLRTTMLKECEDNREDLMGLIHDYVQTFKKKIQVRLVD